jgi:hypothetical protein
LLVGRPQQRALCEQLWICVVGLGKGIGKCLSLHGERCQADNNASNRCEIRDPADAAPGGPFSGRVEAGLTNASVLAHFLRS